MWKLLKGNSQTLKTHPLCEMHKQKKPWSSQKILSRNGKLDRRKGSKNWNKTNPFTLFNLTWWTVFEMYSGFALLFQFHFMKPPQKQKTTTYLWQTVAVSIGGIVPPQLYTKQPNNKTFFHSCILRNKNLTPHGRGRAFNLSLKKQNMKTFNALTSLVVIFWIFYLWIEYEFQDPIRDWFFLVLCLALLNCFFAFKNLLK